MLLFLSLIFTPAPVRSDWASNIEAASNPDDLIEKGILFNEVSKILLTEKFFRVEFLVPFPTYDFTMKPDIEKMIQQLPLMWESHSLFCPLNFSSQFATNTSGFNVHWMLHQIDNESSAAQLDLALIHNETAMFLKPPQPTKSTRQRRWCRCRPSCPCRCWTFRWGTCRRWFRFLWFAWNFWKFPRPIKSKC